MGKERSLYICQSCGFASPKWLGKCPECQAWNTFLEETSSGKTDRGGRGGGGRTAAVQALSEITLSEEHRIVTGLAEFDRVCGGGIVPGSLVLVGGDPVIDPTTHIPDPPNHSGEHRFGMSVGWGKADFYQHQKIKVIPGATYEAGMWAAKADGTDETLEMSWVDGEFGGKEDLLYSAGTDEIFEQWRQFSGVRFTPKSDQITLVIRYRHTSPTNIASIHVDDIWLKIRE